MDIFSLRRAQRQKRKHGAVISIEDPGIKSRVRFHNFPCPDHLVLKFEDIDIDAPDYACASDQHVIAALEFARRYEIGELLIHCHAGICRSTAIGLAVLADRLGPGNEREAVAMLLASNPDAVPTTMLVDMADRLLARDGELKDAWMRHECGNNGIAEYRARKAEKLAKYPEMFARRPYSGFWPPITSVGVNGKVRYDLFLSARIGEQLSDAMIADSSLKPA